MIFYTFLLLDELYKDTTFHLLFILGFHLALLTCEEITLESLKAVPFNSGNRNAMSTAGKMTPNSVVLWGLTCRISTT